MNIERLQKIYYYYWLRRSREMYKEFKATGSPHYVPWRGVPMLKYPTDILVYHRILYEQKPELIIETGTKYGGSALFFADMCELLGVGYVISIDITNGKNVRKLPQHPRITYGIGKSTSDDNIEMCRKAAKGQKTMVVLDSDHHYRNVVSELDAYNELVSIGQYLVVEDTFLNGHPIRSDYGPGPWEAVNDFLPNHPEFEVVPWDDKTILTMNPRGWLKKIK